MRHSVTPKGPVRKRHMTSDCKGCPINHICAHSTLTAQNRDTTRNREAQQAEGGGHELWGFEEAVEVH